MPQFIWDQEEISHGVKTSGRNPGVEIYCHSPDNRISLMCFFFDVTRIYCQLQTICNNLMLPLEFAATTIFDLLLQQTLETNWALSSAVSCPVIGSVEPNL